MQKLLDASVMEITTHEREPLQRLPAISFCRKDEDGLLREISWQCPPDKTANDTAADFECVPGNFFIRDILVREWRRSLSNATPYEGEMDWNLIYVRHQAFDICLVISLPSVKMGEF